MKTTCAPAFAATLARCGLDYPRWRRLARRRWRYAPPARKTRQLLRKVQRVHTGKRCWINGVYR